MSAYDHSKKAVALKYDSDKDKAPVVVASGMGYMAERITEAAMKAGVPVYEDDSLATLLSQLKLGAPIPEDLYRAVVEIYLYFLNYVPKDDTGKNDADMEGTDFQELKGKEEVMFGGISE